MPNPWRKSFVKEESILSEIMSQELCNRLHIYEDFVWVEDIPGDQPGCHTVITAEDKNEPFEVLLNEDTSEAVAIVAQSAVDGGFINNYFDDEYDTEPEENYFEEFHDVILNVKFKPDSHAKWKYATPTRIKRMENGTIPLHKREIKKTTQGSNEVLCNIKFDASTTALLERFIHNRYLGNYNNIIGRGKKSIVIHANCHRKNCITMPFYSAVKVYKIDGNQKNNKIVYKRVQKEFAHLKMLEKLQQSPWPVRAWDNVIVMSCYDGGQYISLATMDIPSDKIVDMYQAIVDFVERAYNKTHLVHENLCPKSILFWEGQTYPNFIGWAHSVKSDHPQALAKLMKDCKFVTEFFGRHGLEVISTEELFKKITGVSRIGNKLMDIIAKRDLYEKYDSNPNRRSPPPIKPNNILRFK